MSQDPNTSVIATLRAIARARHGVQKRSRTKNTETDLSYLDREYIRALEHELAVVNRRYRELAMARGEHLLAMLPAEMKKTCGVTCLGFFGPSEA
jgi:uncharacterized protein (DUF3084 family)